MTAERWSQVERLYHSALEQEPGARDLFLTKACAGDEELRREVESLLDYETKTAILMDRPALEVAARALAIEQRNSMVGRVLGHYRIESWLGAGGMGDVYRGTDTRLDRAVAVKVLSEHLSRHPDALVRFEREAKAVAALSHPNILAIHDFGDDQLIAYSVTELLHGETLRERLTRSPLEWPSAVEIAVSVADGLAAAHTKGITHRDLKPANIFLTEDGRVKILDFGLAQMERVITGEEASQIATRSAITEAGVVLGTVAYMSPEQAQGKKVDVRSDIFSFGSVLYEMLTNQRPFRRDSNISTLAAIIHTEPQPIGELVDGVPPRIEEIILRCLRKDPADRFQNMEDLKTKLRESTKEAEPRDARRAEGFEGPRKKRRWIGAAALTVTVLLLVGGVIWRNFHTASRPSPTARTVRITSFAGTETDPALSPDGNQVAFVWDGENQDNRDIYVKLIDGGSVLRLTTDPAYEASPAWAPDGRRLAFVRRLGGDPHVYPTHAVYVVSALGGSERKIGELRDMWARLSWSPNGKLIALSDSPPDQPSGIFLLSPETGEKRRLTTTPQAYGQDGFPVFSRDGRALAFARGQTFWTQAIYALPLTASGSQAGEARRITPETFYISGLDWTPDGRGLVFSASFGGGSERLFRVSTQDSPGEPQPIATVGDRVQWPSMSIGGTGGTNRLAYRAFFRDINIWRVAGAVPRAKDATARGASPVQIIASTRKDSAPQISADGKRIAFVSERSGSNEVWVCESDGSSPVQVTSMGAYLGSPRWSPDGQRITFDVYLDRQSDIYVVSAQGGTPRRMTFEKSNEVRPSWSRDGRWIYFGSDRTGTDQIWKISAEGGVAVQITKEGGHEAHESFDGKFVFYEKGTFGRPSSGIFRMPAAGGAEVRVLERGDLGNWAISRTGIYLLNSSPASIDYYAFDTGTLKEIVRFSKRTRIANVDTAIAAAPDDRWILYTQVDRFDSDIVMIDNFR
jgi:Tol biopolymer transport system component